MAPVSPELRRARRTIGILVGLSLGLLAVIVFQLRALPSDPDELRDAALADEDVRRAAVRELVRDAGLFDAHPDPEVGRLFLPEIEARDFRGTSVTTNRYGLREAPFRWRKPKDTVRVVLLGDSFVFGWGVEAEERLGVHLARFLEERATGFEGTIECLHVAVPSWNILSECAYLRRKLSDLKPDLVVHVVVPNDLNDLYGVRGFGSMGHYSPQAPAHANAIVEDASFPPWWDGLRVSNPLLLGLDHESRERYARSSDEIADLAAAVEATGGRYLLLARWTHPRLVRLLVPAADQEHRIVYCATDFMRDPEIRLDAGDYHWNPGGHERVAKLLYGRIVADGLLPMLALPPWDEAAAEVERIHERGRVEPEKDLLADFRPLRSELAFGKADAAVARQVYGGLDAQGRAMPAVSLVLAPEGGGGLVVQGRRLMRPELRRGVVEVRVEGHPVGTIPLQGPESFDLRFPLPSETGARELLNVRLVATDHAHFQPPFDLCVSFFLERVAIVE